MDIRRAARADADVLAALGRRTFLQAFAADNDPADIEAYVAVAFAPERLRRELAHPDSLFFLLSADGREVGYLKLNTGSAQTEARGADRMEIERIYLDADMRDRGLGRQLMDVAIQEARARSLKALWLGVWERNASAIAFYRREGFTEVGEHSFTIGGDVQRDLVMERAL